MPESQTAVRVTSEGQFEVVEVPIREPGPRQVRVRVEACGICHSDVLVKEALWPGLDLPRVPGHEVVGTVDSVGSEVTDFSPGDRVGVGWNAGHCFTCERCRAGDFTLCESGQVCGISYDGGYQQYAVFPREALARVPAGLASSDAAPLLCAGVTTYNALRHVGALPGDTVAIQGVGGLGHLGIQYAHHMGFRTVAVSGSAAKESFARELGADEYVDASAGDPAAALAALGGARVILATAPASDTMTAVIDGLAPNGVLLVVGVAAEPIRVSPLQLVSRRARIQGWPSGSARDSEETLAFSARKGIRPLVETFALADAATAFEKMMANRVRFRAVLLPF